MEKLLLIPFLFIVSQVFAQVSVSVHHYDYYNISANKVRPTMSMYVKKDLRKSLKLTSFTLLNNNWGESLIGLEYSPKKWLMLEIQVGMETNTEAYGYKKNLIRTAQILTVSTRKFVFLGFNQQGSFNWFGVQMFYLMKQLGIGAMASQYSGLGPVAQLNLGDSPFRVWASMLYDWDTSDYGSMFGLYYKM
ncbi:MAG: hypothetical protein K9H64_00050 [Bacteroidales bacterium]|nr:hypothetical protein [Bacteroidales bacterium]MCF8454285.1 hypothetical protein [Bacteroidales bacterium]